MVVAAANDPTKIETSCMRNERKQTGDVQILLLCKRKFY